MVRIVDNRLAVGWPGAVLFAAAYAIFASVALATTQTDKGIAVIWPSSGVLVAGLLLLRAKPRMLLLAMIVPVSIAVNLAFGASPGLAIGFTIANVVEGFLAARLACDGGRGCGRFDNPTWVVRYGKAAFCAATVSATIGTLASGLWSNPEFFASWFSTVLLGILIVTPLIVTGLRALAGEEKLETARWKAASVILLAFASVFLTFNQSFLPLLFLPLAATVLATYVAGMTGALAMVLIITLVGTFAASSGTGPISMVDGRVGQIYFFQFYLLTIFATSLPLAALLARSRAQMAEINLRKAQHDAAQAFAHVGHWRYCLKTNTSHWSDGMFHIYGLDPGSSLARNLEHGSIIPADRERVRKTFEQAVLDRGPFTLSGRLETANGEIRHIESLGDVEVEDGKVVALFGVLKDVTEHVRALEEIATEKARAEALAREAILLSETDQLTNVANRRKLMQTLSEDIARAEMEGSDLSIILIDVDHFKSINDVHGHAIGDQVLREIAALGQGALRDGDLFGRFGGEEFLAILPHTPGHVAARVGERFRQQCSERKWLQIDGLGTVSISLGVSTHQHGADATYLLQAADMALYESKNSGRNRLTIAA